MTEDRPDSERARSRQTKIFLEYHDELRTKLTEYAASRYSAAIPVDELVQQTIVELWEYDCDNPDTRFSEHTYRERLLKIGYVILKRRIVDLFRTWSRMSGQLRGPERTTEHAADSTRLLDEVVEWIGALDKVDQLLLTAGLDRDLPLTSTERVRLHRLRKKLTDWVNREDANGT